METHSPGLAYPGRRSPRAGFSDQSQFTHHFKRLVGFTPGQRNR
jgi:hypothetical protein